MEKEKKPQSGPTDAEKREKWREYYDAALGEPLRWLQHDAAAHDDAALCELRDVHGMAAFGRWWLLCEKLAGRKGHAYDVSTSHGWARLARDLEFPATSDGIAECTAFIGELSRLDLINRESFAEFKRVRNSRIDRTADKAAQDAANGALGTFVRDWGKAKQ